MIGNNSVGGGIQLDKVTAIPSDVLKGKTAYMMNGDKPAIGTLELTGNAQAGHVLAGETFYANDSNNKYTGTMTVNSLLSFSVAAYSGKRLLAKWQNPNQAAGKPYSGVIIRYSTSGYPGATGGTQIYKGVGNNTVSGGQSQAFLDMPGFNSTYYFSCMSYVTCSAGEIFGEIINANAKTLEQITLTIKSTQTYVVLDGYTSADIFCVGGGGGTYTSSKDHGGGGGGGGYTKTAKNIPIAGGQILNCVVGSGGNSSTGGNTTVTRDNIILCSADGGKGGTSDLDGSGNGGSGGGDGAVQSNYYGGSGGSNGSNGYYGIDPYSPTGGGLLYGNRGQGSTTRAFGESNGTLYSGGGGGGAFRSTHTGGGGAGGGGAGGGYNSINGGNGAASTGGGGGGGYQNQYSSPNENPDTHSYGGSGIILIKLK